jgi:hypothetical protein
MNRNWNYMPIFSTAKSTGNQFNYFNWQRGSTIVTEKNLSSRDDILNMKWTFRNCKLTKHGECLRSMCSCILSMIAFDDRIKITVILRYPSWTRLLWRKCILDIFGKSIRVHWYEPKHLWLYFCNRKGQEKITKRMAGDWAKLGIVAGTSLTSWSREHYRTRALYTSSLRFAFSS